VVPVWVFCQPILDDPVLMTAAFQSLLPVWTIVILGVRYILLLLTKGEERPSLTSLEVSFPHAQILRNGMPPRLLLLAAMTTIIKNLVIKEERASMKLATFYQPTHE
jgi:hypothetical protein